MIRMRAIRKVYSTGRVEVEALRGVDLDIGGNEYVAVVGPSGSGKSTLMNIIGCLDTPSSGEYVLSGEAVAGLDLHAAHGVDLPYPVHPDHHSYLSDTAGLTEAARRAGKYPASIPMVPSTAAVAKAMAGEKVGRPRNSKA